MAADELVELEYDLERIRTARHEIADWLKSEHDRDKRDDYELRLEACESLEQFFLARIFRCREAREIRDLEIAPTSVFLLVFEQDRKKRLEWLRTRQTALDATILQYKSKHPRWIETFYGVMDGSKPDETPKKPAAESVQIGNCVSTSGSPPVNNAATEPESAVEAPQPSPSIPPPSLAQEPPLESNPTQPPQSETSAFVAATAAPEQTKPKPVGPPVDRPASGSPPSNNAAAEAEPVIEEAQPVEPADMRNLVPQAEAPSFTHSGDYRKLGLDGATYTVTSDQAAIIRCLAQAYERGLAGVSKKALLAEVGSPSSKVRNFFQREGRKLYRDLIAYDKHAGLYLLRRKPILSQTN